MLTRLSNAGGRWIQGIMGDPSEFGLDDRVFNISLIISIGLNAMLILQALVMQTYFWESLILIGLMMFCLFAYWKVRFKRGLPHLWKIAYISIQTAMLSLSWFFNGGIDGPAMMFYLIIPILAYVLFNRTIRAFFFFVTLLTVIALTSLHLLYPGSITKYRSAGQRYTDLILSFILVLIFILLIFRAVIQNFKMEKNKTELLYARMHLRNQEIERDMLDARLVHKLLLPTRKPQYPHLSVDFRYRSLEAVGGDFLSFTPLGEGGFGVFIGDVSGHGVSAALYLALIKSITNRVCREYGLMPARYLSELNDTIIREIEGRFLTALYGIFIYDEKSGIMNFEFSRGGHPLPILQSAQDRKMTSLYAKGRMLGVFLGNIYENKKITLAPGDRLYLYTDGLPDTTDELENILNTEAFIEIVEKSYHPDLSTTLDNVMDGVSGFRGSAPDVDDIMFVGFEVT